MGNIKHYVHVVGTHAQALVVLRAAHVNPSRLRLIDEPRKLQGLDGKGKVLYFASGSSAIEADIIAEILQYAKLRGWEIQHV